MLRRLLGRFFCRLSFRLALLALLTMLLGAALPLRPSYTLAIVDACAVCYN
jgi:hypothetical protein